MYYKSLSSEETKQIAAKIAQNFITDGKVSRGGVVALLGDLGAGKTTFTQGFAEALNIKEKVISPTFVIQRQHPIPQSNFVLYHLDLYRLENEQNFEQLGLTELFETEDKIVLIEWADKIEKLLPKSTLKINFKVISPESREITTNK